MRARPPRSKRGVVLFPALLWPLAALAGPTLTSLDVVTSPTLSVASEHDGQEVYAAPAGTTAQVHVTAHYDDGSSQDVSADPATTYTSFEASVVSVSGAGALAFVLAPTPEVGGVVVHHGGLSKLLSFHVTP